MSENNNEKIDVATEPIEKLYPTFVTEEDLEELIEDFQEESCECGCTIASEARIMSYQDLMNCLYEAEVRYQFWRNTYEKAEASLWLDTPWDEVFETKKPTVKDKEMWIRVELVEAKELRDSCKLEYDHYRRMYELALKYGLEVVQ